MSAKSFDTFINPEVFYLPFSESIVSSIAVILWEVTMASKSWLLVAEFALKMLRVYPYFAAKLSLPINWM